jgi:4-diphosphocytidyl-2-C-methyl-D-erythritol kinase
MTHARACAKLNLALVVGPLRGNGRHELVTILQKIELFDDLSLEPASGLTVEGFRGDTLVRTALESLAAAAGVEPEWRVRIEKRIPVASGLGGGSSDAAAALALANAALGDPLGTAELHELAARIGADVPFFLGPATQLATGDGTQLQPLDLPIDYSVVLVVPADEVKDSTGSVYEAFDRRDGARGFAARVDALRASLAAVDAAPDLATLPPNDLTSSAVAAHLEQAGAFRADVSGAGPTAYGLFESEREAALAAGRLRALGTTWLTRPTGVPS